MVTIILWDACLKSASVFPFCIANSHCIYNSCGAWVQHYQSNLFHGVLVIELLAKHRVEHESIIDGRLELHFWHVEQSARGL